MSVAICHPLLVPIHGEVFVGFKVAKAPLISVAMFHGVIKPVSRACAWKFWWHMWDDKASPILVPANIFESTHCLHVQQNHCRDLPTTARIWLTPVDTHRAVSATNRRCMGFGLSNPFLLKAVLQVLSCGNWWRASVGCQPLGCNPYNASDMACVDGACPRVR